MPHVVLINPSTRKKGKTIMAKAKRSPAQKRATAKMLAANKSRRRAVSAPKVSRAKPKRRAAPRAAAAAPARRARRRSRPITSRAVASQVGRQLRYRRKNPISFVAETLAPSAIGGAGALGLDILFGVLPLPATLKASPFFPAVKVAGAIGLGMAAGMVVSKKTAGQIAAGAITVTLYNFAKGMLNKASGGKIPGLAEYISGDGVVYADGQAFQVGEYIDGDDALQIGYPNAGMMVGDLMEDGSVNGYETGVYR